MEYKLGDTAQHLGRTLRVVKVEPYTTKNGEDIRLVTWAGPCLDCGVEGVVGRTSARVELHDDKNLRKYCKMHRRARRAATGTANLNRGREHGLAHRAARIAARDEEILIRILFETDEVVAAAFCLSPATIRNIRSKNGLGRKR
jgi:hypothetical protein